jgi:GNAT superfamily N-acetyltransferase
VTDRKHGDYLLTEDRDRVDLDRVHRWLSEESYWAAGRERDVVARSIDGSLPFSILHAGSSEQAGLSGQTGLPEPARLSGQTGLPEPAGLSEPAGSSGHAGLFEQVGFARAVTDGTTFAWICDVFVDPAHRGHGLGTWLIDSILESLSERGIQRFLLATRDAHEVYRRSGFEPVAGPQRFMEIDRRPTRNAILSTLQP